LQIYDDLIAVTQPSHATGRIRNAANKNAPLC